MVGDTDSFPRILSGAIQIQSLRDFYAACLRCSITIIVSNNNSTIVSKVWSFCNTLRDDGVGYGDYLEQLTYLLFLKMADEYSRPPHNRKLPIPPEYNWESLVDRRGAELEVHYSILLRELGKEKGILGQIFTNEVGEQEKEDLTYNRQDF